MQLSAGLFFTEYTNGPALCGIAIYHCPAQCRAGPNFTIKYLGEFETDSWHCLFKLITTKRLLIWSSDFDPSRLLGYQPPYKMASFSMRSTEAVFAVDKRNSQPELAKPPTLSQNIEMKMKTICPIWKNIFILLKIKIYSWPYCRSWKSSFSRMIVFLYLQILGQCMTNKV
jgi:hypothetical protein